jgi:radical SAM superfamily enzyme YgiQ (UPF0313 family)
MAQIKNILLINPLENDLTREYDMYPSGALVLIGTMLNNIGHNIKIIHMASDKIGYSEFKDITIDFKPDIIGITMNTYQTKSAKEISKIVKEVNKNILVVVGGPHPSALKLQIFNDFPWVDVIVVGEGEHTFLEIVNGKNLNEIQGICYDNKINEPRPRIKDLDYIPLPNLDLVGFKENKFVGANPVGAQPSMYIMASRGCPYQCTFCNKSIWGNTTVFRKPEMIVREIQWLHEKYGIKEIFFQDDTFNLNRKWAERIFNLIIENNLNKDIIYKTPFRANEKLVDEDLLKLAKEAGFWLIFYGVENGNQEMLDRMKKGLTVKELKRAFELTHKVGLKTIASFIIGLPGENRKTVEDTFNLWKELKPYVTGYSPAIPFPTTEFEKEIIKKGHLLVTNYDEYSAGKIVVRTDELTKNDLEYLREKYLKRMEKRHLMSLILNRKYLPKIIIDSFKNPKSIARRLKNLFRLLKTVLQK